MSEAVATARPPDPGPVGHAGSWRRFAAITSLALGVLSTCLMIAVAAAYFPRGLTVAAAVLAAGAAAWYGIQRRGWRRHAGLGAGALLALAAVALVVFEGRAFLDALVLVGFLAAIATARMAFRLRAPLPAGPRPAHPVLLWNPRSGGGKAVQYHLVDEATVRGIETVELCPGDDLGALVRQAVADGADALAMAGGDGSQALVATVAAERHLPYACIPAGTRNHLALDLGVDRRDVAGALDALVAGRERVVDLAEVNGRVFVNNVSLGLYGAAVQHAEYRDAKVRTLLQTVPEVLGPDAVPPALRWTDDDGDEHEQAAVVLVSNNPYRLGRVLGDGTRPRMDTGQLGIAVIESGGDRRFRSWTAPRFTVDAPGPVWVGIDGEAVQLDPPLRFAIRPRALQVLIAPHHDGASPTAAVPDDPGEVLPALVRIARGHRHAAAAPGAGTLAG